MDTDLLASYIRQTTAARGVDLFAVKALGYDAAEWAQLTGRDDSTVARNVRRAREMLEDHTERQEGDDDG